MTQNLWIGAAALVLAGCATASTGTEQGVFFNVLPTSAECTVTQTGAKLGTAAAGKGHLTVPKSRFPLNIACTGPGGTEFGTEIQPRLAQKAAIGAAVSLTSAVIDSASGAMYEYPETVQIDVLKGTVAVPPGFETGPRPTP